MVGTPDRVHSRRSPEATHGGHRFRRQGEQGCRQERYFDRDVGDDGCSWEFVSQPAGGGPSERRKRSRPPGKMRRWGR
eukprot:6484164-Amphidinium_carterae.2